MSQDEIVLQLQGITKQFPGILANDNVSLSLHRGEILALLGENGAGKSTLMNIIYGLYHPDAGTILHKGQPVRFASPRNAIQNGIGMVHQHFQLIPVMTVAENVILGEETSIWKHPVAQNLFRLLRILTIGFQRLWGALWRLSIPILSLGAGLLAGQIVLMLLFTLSVHLAHGDQFQTFSFQRLSVADQANLALRQVYGEHPTLTKILLWLPILAALASSVGVLVSGYVYARQTWRHLTGLPDKLVIAIFDLFATLGTIRNRHEAAQRVHDLSRQYGLEVDPGAYIEKLPIGMQQRVEIIKALYRHADILILDEPTAVLTPQESQELFKIMRSLAAQGVSIIFISHKLKEVLAIADTIVVMRTGKVVGQTTPAETDESGLAAMMVGREVILRVAKTPAHPGDVELRVQNLSAKDDRGTLALNNVSFEVHQGEVLGIAGVQGNGQTELVEVLTGLRKPSSGQIEIAGKMLAETDPRTITLMHVSHVPEDRQRYGMVMPFPVADNLVLNDYYVSPFASAPSGQQLPLVIAIYTLCFGILFLGLSTLWLNGLWPAVQSALNLANTNAKQNVVPFIMAAILSFMAVLFAGAVSHFGAALVIRALRLKDRGGVVVNEPAVERNALSLVREFDIRTPSIETSGGSLSGGNQQKMIIAREFSHQPRLLIASQPTRGIDVGAIEFIHQRIIKQRDEGTAVLLVSAELDEIMALSDRIAVMYQGQIIDILPAESVTREQLGLLMAGVKA